MLAHAAFAPVAAAVGDVFHVAEKAVIEGLVLDSHLFRLDLSEKMAAVIRADPGVVPVLGGADHGDAQNVLQGPFFPPENVHQVFTGGGLEIENLEVKTKLVAHPEDLLESQVGLVLKGIISRAVKPDEVNGLNSQIPFNLGKLQSSGNREINIMTEDNQFLFSVATGVITEGSELITQRMGCRQTLPVMGELPATLHGRHPRY